jgi:hypothetical protein
VRYRSLSALAAIVALTAIALAGPAAAQSGTEPPCPPGEVHATIRASDFEDAGGPLTATHTIGLELREGGARVPRPKFTLPGAARARGTDLEPAFSLDTPGPAQVSATWTHYVDNDAEFYACTATTQRTLQLKPPRPLTFDRPIPPTLGLEYFRAGIRAGKDADRRPVEVRLRGVRRARLPGPGSRLQRVTLAFRDGDAGMPVTSTRKLRAAGWKFHLGFVSRDEIGIGAQVIDSHRGRRGRARGFGLRIVFVQAGHRVGSIRATGRCGYLGCYGTLR